MKRLFAVAALISAGACGDGCVSRGSAVLTPRGRRPIEELRVGDDVYSFDPDRGELVKTQISATKQARRECLRLAFPGGAIILTSNHPVFCPEAREWRPAGDWLVGSRAKLLRVDEVGAWSVQVTAVDAYVGVFDVFDITVEHALHNFVAEGVLVHNKPPIQPRCMGPDGGEIRHEAGIEECTTSGGGRGAMLCINPGEQAECVPDAQCRFPAQPAVVIDEGSSCSCGNGGSGAISCAGGDRNARCDCGASDAGTDGGP